MAERTNPITPAGFAALRARYEQLFAIERPVVVEIVHWAAGNGDRSENGDYIYGRQKLRAIDRELGQLSKKMKAAQILDPSKQEDRSRIFFGACNDCRC
jgi:transcription elongation factor GreB